MTGEDLSKLGNKIVLLENIRSLHNVGSIFRTADGAGWSGLILGGYTGCPPDRRIEKVSLGAENSLAWLKSENPAGILQELKKNGFKIISLEQTDKSQNLLTASNEDDKTVLVLGNEIDGVSEEVLAISDYCYALDMHGQKSSLNVSVAGGIAMYLLRGKK